MVAPECVRTRVRKKGEWFPSSFFSSLLSLCLCLSLCLSLTLPVCLSLSLHLSVSLSLSVFAYLTSRRLTLPKLQIIFLDATSLTPSQDYHSQMATLMLENTELALSGPAGGGGSTGERKRNRNPLAPAPALRQRRKCLSPVTEVVPSNPMEENNMCLGLLSLFNPKNPQIHT